MIYLDHAATTPMRAAAWEAMRPFAADVFGNPSSAHAAGRKARQALEDARDRIARCLDCRGDEVVFTSGATEANNLALLGQTGPILSTDIEHPCVVEPLRKLAERGVEVAFTSANAFVDRLTSDTRLGVMMLVNHETGAIHPVREAAAKVALHCDAAQAVGKIPVSFRDLGVATLSVSGHKFGGPKGVGVLVVRHGTKLTPQMFGGHQQQGRRPGTEPVALAVGMAVALEEATSSLAGSLARQHEVKRAFVARLGGVVNSPDDGSPFIVNVSFPGCRADVLLMRLDLAGIACSTGSACSSGSLLPSPVLKAMGVSDEVLRSAMRFSFGADATAELAVDAADRIMSCMHAVRNP